MINKRRTGSITFGFAIPLAVFVLAFGPWASPSSAASKVARACTYVSPADVRVLTGKDLATPLGVDTPTGSQCTYSNPKFGSITVAYFDNVPEKAMTGLMVVLGKNKKVDGVSGASLWLADRRSSLLIRKGTRTLQVSMVGITATSESTAKAFTDNVVRRLR
jgi:hypothetical protein